MWGIVACPCLIAMKHISIYLLQNSQYRDGYIIHLFINYLFIHLFT